MAEIKESEEDSIRQRLKDEGLDPACTEQEKIAHLWRIFMKTESHLKASLGTVAELQSQQAEEMKEFENYVEHVKSLSTEREALTVEFAAENDSLKAENDQLRQEVDSYKNDETRDMLLQQGLDDIAHGTASEQIAYLLVERARLMDELDMAGDPQTSQSTDAPRSSAQMFKILEQERAEFEDELRQQRDSMNRTREALKASHEEEISALMAENEHLQDLLDSAKAELAFNKTEQSSQHSSNESLNEQTNKNLLRELEALKSDKEEELLSWKRRVRDLDDEHHTLVENLERQVAELKRDKGRLKEQLDEYEETNKKLREDRKHQEQRYTDIELEKHKLTSEKKSITLRMDYMEKEMEDLRQREQDLASKQRTLLPVAQDADSQLRRDFDSIKLQKEGLDMELDQTKLLLRSEKEKVLDLEFKVKRSETKFDDRQTDFLQQETQFKNKVTSLRSQVESLEDELADSRRQIHSVNNNVKTSLEASLSHTETQLQEVKATLQAVKSQKEELQQQLDRQHEQNMALRTQHEGATAHVTRLKATNQQIESENEEMAKKLQDAKRDCVQKERDLIEERDKFHERHFAKDDRLNKAHSEMDELQREIRKATNELHMKQEQITQLELQLQSEKTQSQSGSTSLRREIETLQTSHVTEIESVTQKLDNTLAENSKLRLDVSDKQQEIDRLREDIAKVKVNDASLERSGAQSDMAWMNKHNKDISQAKLQQDFYKKSAMLETSNDTLRTELDKQTIELSTVRAELAKLKGERSAETLIAQTRAETAERKPQADLEKKLFELQRELIDTNRRQELVEKDASQTAALRTELRFKTDEIIKLTNQLQDERFKKISGSTVSEEMTQQVAVLRQRETDLQKRNNELQHMLLDVESRLETFKTQTRSNADVRHEAEQSQQSLHDQVASLQQEADSLRVELLKVSDKYDIQLVKYSERKNRTKVQLIKARDYFTAEKTKLKGELERLERELRLTKAVLTKEVEWKENQDNRHHDLLQEKRQLLAQLTEQGEVVRDHGRQLSVIQVRCKFLEEENNTLQQRVDSLVRQKQNLDRIIKEYQFERHKEELQKIFTLNTNVLVSPRSFLASLGNDGLQTDHDQWPGGQCRLLTGFHPRSQSHPRCHRQSSCPESS